MLARAVAERGTHESAHSWLRGQGASLAAQALDACRADLDIGRMWERNGTVVLATGDRIRYEPELWLPWFVSDASEAGAEERSLVVDRFLALLRVEPVIDVTCEVTVIGPTLVGVDHLDLAIGRLIPISVPSPQWADRAPLPAVTLTATLGIGASLDDQPADDHGTARSIEDQATRLLLILALAAEGPLLEHETVVRPRFTAAGVAAVDDGGPRLAGVLPYVIRPGGILDDLRTWSRRIAAIDVGGLAVAVRRLLQARTERARSVHRIIDHAIALEAMTGLSSSRRRGPVIARLLGRTDIERRELESQHRRLTDARDLILHEGTTPQDAESLSDEGAMLVRRLIVEFISRGGRLEDPALAGDAPPLAIEVRRVSPSPKVLAARKEYDRHLVGEEHQLAIDAVLLQLDATLRSACTWHAAVLDVTDLDPLAPTRPAAAWRMAGRSLSLAVALARQPRLDIGNAGTAVARSMHEANRLLAVFLDSEEDALLRRWLSDESVRPEDARHAAHLATAQSGRGGARRCRHLSALDRGLPHSDARRPQPALQR